MLLLPFIIHIEKMVYYMLICMITLVEVLIFNVILSSMKANWAKLNSSSSMDKDKRDVEVLCLLKRTSN